ncbi:MAG TPA: LLM class flavin-dependent oxidoreductase [Steroidobacteraceae bacterium]|nr:LLM class flavin-dependent oxidoreductase [Steroidobacteraceae bacterium]
MRFGIFDHCDASGLPLAEHYETRLQLIEAAERLGFHSYHVAEHHGTPLGLAPSPSVYLAALAQRTRRILLGPMVYVAVLYHPMRLAEEICMLDQLSRGRLQLGIGRGGVWLEHELYGVERETSAERFAEARDLLLAALAGGEVSFAGKHFRVPRFPMVLEPYQKPRPPLWYGIGNPDSAAWAAAERANIVSLQPAAVARRTLDRYRDEWQRLGRAPQDLPLLGLARHVVVAESEAAALATARAAFCRWRQSFSILWEQRGVAFPLAYPRDWDALQESGLCIAGTPAAVRDYLLRQSQAAGATGFLCHMIFGEMPAADALRSLTLFATEVAPALAGA